MVRESRTKDYSKRLFSLVSRTLFTDEDPDLTPCMFYLDLVGSPRSLILHGFCLICGTTLLMFLSCLRYYSSGVPG